MNSSTSLVNESEILIHLRAMIQRATGLDMNRVVMAADSRPAEKLPQGEEPYCSVEIRDIIPYGAMSSRTEEGDEPGTLKHVLSQSYEVPIRLNIYRAGSPSLASNLVGMNRIPSITQYLVQNKIGFTSKIRVGKRPYILSNTAHQRAIVDFTLSMVGTRFEFINPIKRVDVVVNVEDTDNSFSFEAGINKEPRES